jgi:hypothetical protein
MMPITYLNNTDFEFELANPQLSIFQSWEQHLLCQQLQYLPLLYANPEDTVAVSAFPTVAFLKEIQQLKWRNHEPLAHLVNWEEKFAFKGQTCLVWGASQQMHRWAQEREMHYPFSTDWEIIREINSKAFSHCYSILPEAALLADVAELERWLQRVKGKKVIKTCFGLSGKGNRLISQNALNSSLLLFCNKEWNEGRVMIGEPWLDKVFDFSSQWIIHSQGSHELLGLTVFETDEKGMYLGTLAGNKEKIFGSFLSYASDHQVFAKKVLTDLAQKGFFGYVGIDALIYRLGEKICLYPIVEINARQTMSSVALRLQKKWFPEHSIRLRFTTLQDPQPSLLPLELLDPVNQSVARCFKRKFVLEDLS